MARPLHLQGNVTTAVKAGVRLEIPNRAVLDSKGLTVKQEEHATDSDVEAAYTPQAHATYNNHNQFLCKKHKQPFEYIDRPLSSDWIPDYKREEIHLKPGEFIIRGEPCIGYADEFSPYCVYGNEVKLYNNNLKKLRKLIKNKRTPNSYYVCHMTKTFATPGKRMDFLVPFSKGSIYPHMDASNELPVSNGDGTVNATVRFIKGVDNRATITKNWSAFFQKAEMKEGRICAAPQIAGDSRWRKLRLAAIDLHGRFRQIILDTVFEKVGLPSAAYSAPSSSSSSGNTMADGSSTMATSSVNVLIDDGLLIKSLPPKIGIVTIDDANFAELKICKRKLQAEEFWSSALYDKANALGNQLSLLTAAKQKPQPENKQGATLLPPNHHNTPQTSQKVLSEIRAIAYLDHIDSDWPIVKVQDSKVDA
ncbi:hypothetical protein TRIUR3_20374 [Triticum urartu]|uniref:Uncharacterized protein n=1 Tax=Triticum urartu TaxID=4572 RepID=M7ZQB1_TRIUA|nr:hypothetical protein TRIUR3_20374 [Triticum urartu]